MAGGDKTEKATPKRRDESRKKGQVARSQDVNGSAVLLAGLFAISLFGAHLVAELQDALRHGLTLASRPSVVGREGLGEVLGTVAQSSVLAVAPIVLACLVGGVLANVAQVRWHPSPQALKPDFKKINPLSGAKNLFGPNAAFEGVKSILKVAAVSTVGAMAILPKLDEMGAMVGMPADELGGLLVSTVLEVAQRAGFAYLVIAGIDYAWQWRRHEKQLKMDHQEIKEEGKGQALPAEVRSAIRRRQMQAARARMMEAVPQADVVVVNPTHFAVALRYDGTKSAPEIVAKGQDLIAAHIRREAEAAGVPIVSDPPLARSLHATVEIGELVPEELFQAVAELLAFVYRTAGRRGAA